jgi:hypothetical protein
MEATPMRFLRPLLLSILIPLAACGGSQPDDSARPEGAAPAGDPSAATDATAGRSGTRNGFEGVITAVVTSDGERTQSTMWVKGSRVRIDMEMDGERGAIIHDANGRTISLLESARQYFVFPEVPADDDEPMRFTATGQSETVAGYRCQFYRIQDPNGVQDGDEACITTELGWVGFGAAGIRRAADERALRQQFRDGFLILKSREPQGGTEFEVTRIERTSVSDDRFAPPPGFTEMRTPGLGSLPGRP